MVAATLPPLPVDLAADLVEGRLVPVATSEMACAVEAARSVTRCTPDDTDSAARSLMHRLELFNAGLQFFDVQRRGNPVAQVGHLRNIAAGTLGEIL